jgi:hypothetical protein
MFNVQLYVSMTNILFIVYTQYDFPNQETVIQFIIDAIQAEAFNPRTLFLIGTYTIGEFLDVFYGKIVSLWVMSDYDLSVFSRTSYAVLTWPTELAE